MFLVNKMLGLCMSILLVIMTCKSANSTSYNTKKQICCNGMVYAIGQSRSPSCCGNSMYDSLKSICCPNNQVIDTPSKKTDYAYGCCLDPVSGNSVPYEHVTQSCCNGKVIKAPNACCGNKDVYNTETQVCCNKYTYTDNSPISDEYRINDIADNKTVCCGLDNYDYRKSVCCDNDIITPKKEGMEEDYYGHCCGKEPYERHKQVCCGNWNGSIKLDNALYDMIDTYSTCCGIQLINFATEACCDGVKKPAKRPESIPGSWLTCCGDQVVNDPETQICIDDKIQIRKGPTYYSCGKEQYDSLRQFCCNDQIYESNGDYECCYTAKIPEIFNPLKQICCSDGIKPLTNEEQNKGNNACCAPNV